MNSEINGSVKIKDLLFNLYCGFQFYPLGDGLQRLDGETYTDLSTLYTWAPQQKYHLPSPRAPGSGERVPDALYAQMPTHAVSRPSAYGTPEPRGIFKVK